MFVFSVNMRYTVYRLYILSNFHVVGAAFFLLSSCRPCLLGCAHELAARGMCVFLAASAAIAAVGHGGGDATITSDVPSLRAFERIAVSCCGHEAPVCAPSVLLSQDASLFLSSPVVSPRRFRFAWALRFSGGAQLSHPVRASGGRSGLWPGDAAQGGERGEEGGTHIRMDIGQG